MRLHSHVGLITNSSSEVFIFQGDKAWFINALNHAAQEWANRAIDSDFADIEDRDDVPVVKAIAYGLLFIDFGEAYMKDDLHVLEQAYDDFEGNELEGQFEVSAGQNGDNLPWPFREWFRSHYGDFGFRYYGRNE